MFEMYKLSGVPKDEYEAATRIRKDAIEIKNRYLFLSAMVVAIDCWAEKNGCSLDETTEMINSMLRIRERVYSKYNITYNMKSNKNKCSECGEDIDEKANFCPNCGADVRDNSCWNSCRRGK